MSVDKIKACIGSDIEMSEVGVMPGVANRREMEKIRGEVQEDAVPDEGEIYYDIRFSAYLETRKERIRLLINVEAQKAFYPGYSLTTRGIFYGARMISAQKGIEFAIPMESKAMGEELNQMCNLSDYVEELGIQKGIEKGKEQILMHLIEKKLEKGMSVSEIADALEETEEVVYRMIDGMK